MLSNLKKINELLTRKQRLAGLCLLGVMLLIGLMQVASVTSVLPFMAVVGNPEVIETNRWINMVYEGLGFTSNLSFLIFLGLVMLTSILCLNAVSIFSVWLNARFTWALNVHISRSLLAKYLSQPYLFFVSRNSSEFSHAVLQETQYFTNGYVTPLLQVIAKGVTIISLFTLVFLVDPLVATLAIFVFGGLYLAIYSYFRKKLGQIGHQRVEANRKRYKSVSEAFGSVKENKILQREGHFVRSYDTPSRLMGKLEVTLQLIGRIPHLVLETLAFGGMIALVLYFLVSRGGVGEILPILSLYAFASYRIMPALQTIFKTFTQLRSSQAVLDLIYRDMTAPLGAALAIDPEEIPYDELDKKTVVVPESQRDLLKPESRILPFQSTIELRDLTFNYPEAPRPALKNVSLSIPFNRSVAFCGPTGSGKTTAVDIILGLLEPSAGALLVDGVRITPENRRQWQRNLGYVPQSIYLSDSTITENIAFGIPRKEIDHAAVEQAARIANIADFIESELPLGYETLVGERGVRLSGGQRQRIGIARALYHDPSVLVLDEATSALDGATEEAVMQAVKQVAEAKTVILIAHRLSTVKDCDTIFLLDHGRLVMTGTYEDLMKNSKSFQRMARQPTPVG